MLYNFTLEVQNNKHIDQVRYHITANTFEGALERFRTQIHADNHSIEDAVFCLMYTDASHN